MNGPYYDRHGVTVHAGDCLDVLRDLPDASVDAVVTDPPYSLSFMGRDWDRHDSPAEFQEWCRRWANQCLRVLKPGGHLLAFGGSRTAHRLAAGIEDAGFEMRDGIMWIYGSGFPKSLDVSKAIDKLNGRDMDQRFALARHIREQREAAGISRAEVAARFPQYREVTANWERTDEHGNRVPTLTDWAILAPWLDLSEEWLPLVKRLEAERDVVGQARNWGRTRLADGKNTLGDYAGSWDVTSPATEAAREWQGWGTALKPAHEPIILARRPLAGTVAANVLAHGTGALNIDSARVEGDRWPANVLLGHGVDCSDTCCEGCPVAELDRQSGITVSGANPSRRGADGARSTYGEFAGQDAVTPLRGANVGGASRFFPTFRWEAKAPTSERPQVDGISHPTVKPLALMRWLVRLLTPPGGLVLDPFAGSGTTLHAARAEGFRAIGIEREPTYLPLIKARLDARPRAASGTQTATDNEPMDLLDLITEDGAA